MYTSPAFFCTIDLKNLGKKSRNAKKKAEMQKKAKMQKKTENARSISKFMQKKGINAKKKGRKCISI